MASENNPPSSQGPGDEPPRPAGDGGAISQQFSHVPVSARVPDKVAAGVLSTGAIVLDSPNEFIIDFLQGLTRPARVAARVVMTPAVVDQFILALRDNLAKYEQTFGAPPPLPKPPTDRRPTIQEIYDDLKVPDELLSGAFANGVMIGHSPAEFFLDFITRFFPTAAVSSRVYLAAPQIPRLLDTLNIAMQNFRKRQAAAQGHALPLPPNFTGPAGQGPAGQGPVGPDQGGPQQGGGGPSPQGGQGGPGQGGPGHGAPEQGGQN